MNTFTQARLDLIEYAAVHTLDEFLSKALDEVGVFLDSPIGFYHFVESDQKTLPIQQWSTRTLKEFCRAEGKDLHYSIDRAGVWADCVREGKPVIHNDYPSLKHKKGMPEGHVKVVRELVTPVMREGKVVAIMGVGNKPEDYTGQDAEFLAYFADVTWEVVERKRAQESLRESEEKFRLVFQTNPDAICLNRLSDGMFLDINDGFTKTTGYTRDEVIGKTSLELNILDSKDRERLVTALESTGAVEDMEGKFCTKDGEIRIGLMSARVLRIKQEDVILSVSRDITERKRAEELSDQRTRELAALQTLGIAVSSSLSPEQISTAALRGMLEAVQPDLAFLFLRDGERLLLHEVLPPEAQQRLGVVPEHLVGECLCGLTVLEGRPVHSDDIHSDRRCTWDECKQAGIRSLAALPVRSGEEIIAVIGLASMTERNFEAQTGFLETLTHQVSTAMTNARLYEAARRELSERKLAEQALKESEERFRQIARCEPDLVWTIDLSGRFTYVNPAVERIHGWTVEEFLQLNLRDIVTPQQAVKSEAMLEEALSKAASPQYDRSTIRTFESEHLHKDGSTFLTEVSTALLWSDDGKPVGIIGITRDITERKAMFKNVESLARFPDENPNPILRFAKDGEILYANKSSSYFLESTCYEPNKKIPVDWRQEAIAALNSNSIREFELECSGTIYSLTFAPIKDMGYVNIYGRDITAHKRAEAERRLSEMRLRKAEVVARLGNWEFIMGRNEVKASEGAKIIYGLEGSGWSITEVQTYPLPEYRGMLDRALKELIEDGKPYNLEHKIRRPSDGKIIDIHSIAEYSPENGVVFGVIQDITERKKADQALRDSELKYRTLIEHIPQKIFYKDRESTYISCNDFYAQDLGIRAAEIAGKTDFEFFPRELAEKYRADDLRVMETGQEIEVEEDYIEGGNLRTVLTKKTPVRDDNGEVHGVLGVFTDITERKRAEKDLSLRESYLTAMIENQPGLVWLKDTEGRFLAANHALARLCGVAKPEDILGKTDFDINPKELAEKYRADDEEVMRRGTPVVVEEPISEQGERKWFETFKTPVFNVDGQVVGTSGYARDITERKQAEEDRRLNESRLEVLLQLNQMTDASLHEIAEFTMEEAVRLTQSTIGYVAFMNDDETVLSMHAWSRAAMHECRIDDKPLEYPVETTGLWGEAVRQRRPIITNDYQAPNPLKRGTPHGHVAVLRHMNVPIFDGARIVLVAGVGNKATGYDESDVLQLSLLMTGMWRIVQRKRAEDALRQSRESFQELAELLPETIFEMDINGRLTFVNRNAYDHFGYSREDLERGLNGFDLISPEDRPRALERTKEIMSGGRSSLNEFKAIRKDGSTFPTLIRMTAKLCDSEPVGLRGIVIDVTETKKLESRLRQAQKLEAVGTLAGGIAHDFNNILAAIIGFTELALRTIPEEDQLWRNLNQVLKAAFRAKDLVKQILTFSRQTEQERKPVQIASIVKEALKLLRSSLPTTIEIRQDMAHIPDGDVVLADPTQIHQVLMNLCTNAAHAMRTGGGVLSLSLSKVDAINVPERLDLSARPYLKLSVTDTGHGMDAAVLERIFDPYFTTKGPGEGTGLGLSVVQGIVKNHGGAITVYSEPGQGTIFNVFLPTVEEIVTAEARTQEVLLTGSERILFVDDEIALVDLGKETLVSLGYNVTAKTSSREALETFRAEPDAFDLIITDMTMPELTGIALANGIWAIRKKIPIILCSGFSEQINGKQAHDLGICEFVMKPYTIATLAQTVRKALERK